MHIQAKYWNIHSLVHLYSVSLTAVNKSHGYIMQALHPKMNNCRQTFLLKMTLQVLNKRFVVTSLRLLFGIMQNLVIWTDASVISLHRRQCKWPYKGWTSGRITLMNNDNTVVQMRSSKTFVKPAFIQKITTNCAL